MERPRALGGWDDYLAQRVPRGLSNCRRGGCDKDSLDNGAKWSTSNLVLRASRQFWVALVSIPFCVVCGDKDSGHGRAGHTKWMNGWMGYVQPCFFYFAMLQRTRQYWMRDVQRRQLSIRGPEWPRVGKTMY